MFLITNLIGVAKTVKFAVKSNNNHQQTNPWSITLETIERERDRPDHCDNCLIKHISGVTHFYESLGINFYDMNFLLLSSKLLSTQKHRFLSVTDIMGVLMA